MKKLVVLIMFFILASSVYADKVYIFNFNYDNGKITLKNQIIKEGYYPDRKILVEEGYTCSLLDSQSEKFYSFKFELPNKVYTDTIQKEGLEGGVITLNNTDFSFIMPYSSGVNDLVCYNIRGYEILREPVVNPTLSPSKNRYLLLLYGLLGLVALILIFYLLRKSNK